MRFYKKNCGPFPISVYYLDTEIEDCADRLLKRCDLLPTIDTAEVDVDMVLEKAFNMPPSFADLSIKGAHGATHFRKDGSFEIFLDRELSKKKGCEKRYRSTLAHEIGHIELHRHLFIKETLALYNAMVPEDDVPVLCRSFEDTVRGYSGEWWEWQANRFMSALLMPRFLIIQMCRRIRESNYGANMETLKVVMIKDVLERCNVSNEAARIRIEQLNIGSEDVNQLALNL